MTSTEITEQVEQAPAPQSLLPAIIALSKDRTVDVAKLQALLEMQERMEARQAQAEFNAAHTRLAARMPRVRKNGTVQLIAKDGRNLGSYSFAKWEDIDTVIRPLLAEEGFSLSFNSKPRSGDGGGLVVSGTLLHRDGHSMTAEMPLPLDGGAGRNNLQATGSTLSYGKRYVTEMLLNIVREGEDDDGASADNDLISNEEVAELSRGLTETRSDLGGFLHFMQVERIGDIQRRDLTRARNAIAQKRRASHAHS